MGGDDEFGVSILGAFDPVDGGFEWGVWIFLPEVLVF